MKNNLSSKVMFLFTIYMQNFLYMVNPLAEVKVVDKELQM